MRALLRKIRSALALGGVTATLEFVPNDDRVTPVMAAQFSMMMLGTTAKGDAYTLRDLGACTLRLGSRDRTWCDRCWPVDRRHRDDRARSPLTAARSAASKVSEV